MQSKVSYKRLIGYKSATLSHTELTCFNLKSATRELHALKGKLQALSWLKAHTEPI